MSTPTTPISASTGTLCSFMPSVSCWGNRKVTIILGLSLIGIIAFAIYSYSRWDNRKVTIILGLSLIGIVAFAIYFYTQRCRIIVLKRDPDGFYTLPHFEVPGYKNTGIHRSLEIFMKIGTFVIDTKNGIVPPGWILKP